MAETKRSKYEILRGQLESERSTFLTHWRELSDLILPRRSRFTMSDVNKGDRRNQRIIDSTATLAVRTLRSGMMSGITSPARPWFRLTTPDPDLAEYGAVKEWLHLISGRISSTFLKSNLYNALPILYGDMGVFATGAMCVEEDFDDTLRCYPFSIGSYCIANNYKLKVDVFFRDYQMTVRQLVEKFGQLREDGSGQPDWSTFSSYVKSAWDRGEYETWIGVCHVIKPNPDFDPNKIQSKYKKYLSCYYERGAAGTMSGNYLQGPDDDRYLRESGYDYFPVLAPRWEVTGEDVYGTDCPGMTALGDIKQLQIGEKRGAQAIEKMVNPPMVGPTSLRNSKASILPGDITYQDSRSPGDGFRPAHEVQFRILELEQKQAQVRQRIQRAFYEDLFLMLAESDRRQITAREIDERHEEKLLALGPVLEQVGQDLLDPLIDITFNFMVAQGQIPPAPPELQGVPLKVEYVSIMAQAQKLVGVSGLERFVSFVGQVAQFKPDALDKIDIDQAIDTYGEMTSIAPKIIRTDEETEKIRSDRAQQQQAAARSEQIQNLSGAAKNLSGANLEGDNALSRIVEGAGAGAEA